MKVGLKVSTKRTFVKKFSQSHLEVDEVAKNQPLGVQSLHQLVKDSTNSKEPIAGFKSLHTQKQWFIFF
jgi:hypothetical protein